MIDKKVEEELLLPMIIRAVSRQVNNTRVIVDHGSTDRDCDWFEIYFAGNPHCDGELNPDFADSSELLLEIAQEASQLIVECYATNYQNNWKKTACIGICLDSEWIFDEEDIPELEAMIGTKFVDDAFVGCWRFAVRFAPEIVQVEGRCCSIPTSKLEYLRDRTTDLDDQRDAPAA